MLKILILGPIFNSKSGPMGPGGLIYKKFQEANFKTFKRSSIRNKILRMIDIATFTLFLRSKYNIILLQSYGLLAFYMEDFVSRVAVLFKKPIIFTIHGGAFNEFFNRHNRWCNKVLKRATRINTPSIFLKDFLTEKGFKVDYVPNFIDLSKFPYSRIVNEKVSLLWVRAFHDIYHPELAIESFAIIKHEFPEAKMTMIGPDQGTREKCELLIKELKLVDSIALVGYVPNNELYKYYQSHSVYLNTTRYESFGVALIEAGSCGIPCVSTGVGEIPYIWKDGENILLAERDAQLFADQIRKLLTDEELNKSISVNAHKNAQKYTWENVKNYWINTIEELTNPKEKCAE